MILNDALICDKCSLILHKRIKFLRVIGSYGEYLFCKSCVKDGLNALLLKPNKNPEEMKLMKQFSRWLRKDFH